MSSLEHPLISEMNRKGFLGTNDSAVWGRDYYNNIIYQGDDVAEFDGDIVLKDNLERYLSEVWDFKFHTME